MGDAGLGARRQVASPHSWDGGFNESFKLGGGWFDGPWQCPPGKCLSGIARPAAWRGPLTASSPAASADGQLGSLGRSAVPLVGLGRSLTGSRFVRLFAVLV